MVSIRIQIITVTVWRITLKDEEMQKRRE